ncbi:DUF6328 family protein [Streptomyces sp. KMM 9044]|uniref:DUF6328 family protein n=1 Tax=Streptomyces sp. KMM 9044 TaxID=2744474 RepID=UPI002150CB65|nr:DUF6328 family protein [Streptomyces sp. KMM 9044]WAX81543.1 DUF6328 family protein [Streptomyces sp. KMM 9044]
MSHTQQGESGRRGLDESEEERADRMWQELVQEVRVAQTGVRILLGFLLTVVFTPEYAELSDVNQKICIVTVVLGACAAGALIGPLSLHRLVSGRRVKPQAVRWAARLTMLGLLLLLATAATSLLLVLGVATDDDFVPYLVAGMAAWYLLCWFALPMWTRHRHTAP